MRSNSPASKLVVGAMALWLACVFGVAAASAAALESQTNSDAGVYVTVTPKPIGSTGIFWEFEVSMDTHTKPLDTDLAQAAVLTDDGGGRYAPVSWQGDPPGGHHRKGYLQFPLPQGKPKAIELKIEDLGGVAERVFRWELDG
jgi:hypothetical protein